MSQPHGRVRARVDRVNGISVYSRYSVADAGSSRRRDWDRLPIVLVHGLVVSSAYLRPALAELAGDHRAYAPDMPGYGRSDKPDRPLTLEEQSDLLGLWMQALGLRRAALVGCSLGTQVVSLLAVRQPALVERVVLLSPTMDPAARRPIVALARWARELRYELAMLPIMLHDYARAGIPRAMATFEMARADRPEERLGKLSAPTLVLRGELDPLVSQAWAEEVTRLLPAARLRVVDGQAHALNFRAPALFAELVRDFLAKQSPGAPTGEA